MKKNIFCSVSFGRSSAAMAIHLAINAKYRDCNILFAFANTSKEREETLKFGKQLSDFLNIVWIEGTYPMKKGKGIGYKVVNFETAKRNGEVFEAMLEKANIVTVTGNKVGLPNHGTPYCSDRLKKIPLHKLAKDYFKGEKYVTAIGFRREDVEVSRRITYAEIREIKDYIYPLITDFMPHPLSQRDVSKVIETAGYNLKIPSKWGNCDGCWKRSEQKQVEMLREGVLNPDWWRKMENQYNDKFYRGFQSIDDLMKKAKLPISLDVFEDNGEACLCGT